MGIRSYKKSKISGVYNLLLSSFHVSCVCFILKFG
jgi:hypothetical protein